MTMKKSKINFIMKQKKTILLLIAIIVFVFPLKCCGIRVCVMNSRDKDILLSKALSKTCDYLKPDFLNIKNESDLLDTFKLKGLERKLLNS